MCQHSLDSFSSQARRNLVATFQSIVDERRAQKKAGNFFTKKKDMMDALVDVQDEDGRKLTDEEIIDILVMYLNAGHESSGHTMMWATVLLQEHPKVVQKAKVLEFRSFGKSIPVFFFFFFNVCYYVLIDCMNCIHTLSTLKYCHIYEILKPI